MPLNKTKIFFIIVVTANYFYFHYTNSTTQIVLAVDVINSMK